MKFTHDQYDAIIIYMNEHLCNFTGGNSKHAPALREANEGTMLTFRYMDADGDKRTFDHFLQTIPEAIYKIYGFEVNVIDD